MVFEINRNLFCFAQLLEHLKHTLERVDPNGRCCVDWLIDDGFLLLVHGLRILHAQNLCLVRMLVSDTLISKYLLRGLVYLLLLPLPLLLLLHLLLFLLGVGQVDYVVVILCLLFFVGEGNQTLLKRNNGMRLCGEQGLPGPRLKVVRLSLKRILGLQDICSLQGPVQSLVFRFRLLGRRSLVFR
jgi:hypothetical protein